MNAEGYASYRPIEIPVDPHRVESVIDTEWCVEHGQHDLQIDSSTHPQTGVRSRQELGRQRLNETWRHNLAFQFSFFQHPGISAIHEGN